MNATSEMSAWKDADSAWQSELEREYGKHAGDARYDDSRNERTARLSELRAEFHRTQDVYLRKWAEVKKYNAQFEVRHNDSNERKTFA